MILGKFWIVFVDAEKFILCRSFAYARSHRAKMHDAKKTMGLPGCF